MSMFQVYKFLYKYSVSFLLSKRFIIYNNYVYIIMIIIYIVYIFSFDLQHHSISYMNIGI